MDKLFEQILKPVTPPADAVAPARASTLTMTADDIANALKSGPSNRDFIVRAVRAHKPLMQIARDQSKTILILANELEASGSASARLLATMARGGVAMVEDAIQDYKD